MQLCFNLERDHPVGLIEKECLGDLLAVFSQNDLFLCTEKLPD